MRLSIIGLTLFTLILTAAISGEPHHPPFQDGRQIFRHDTFGDEQLWTRVLRMPEAISQVDPTTALAVGLKVDADALPPALIHALRAGRIDLTAPATTVELLKLDAI